ncbi:hypothetical protein R1flu_015125 [Riccia fluitans]|uniref:Uncharacterized protein n=1 Tax=Riccia fluitans TaxID=41844 RepID=A0ABD1YI19_9MARC
MVFGTWPSVLKARVGQRIINVVQVFIILSLGSVVLLRDSLRFGIDISLNTSSPVEASAINGIGMQDLTGPKRNIASVKEKNVEGLESLPIPTDTPTDSSTYEQRSSRKSTKPRDDQVEEDGFKTQEELRVESVPLETNKVVDENSNLNSNKEEELITEFDKARESRGRHRGKDVSKELQEDKDVVEVNELEHMVLPREFTIPEDLQELQPKDPEIVAEEKVKPTKNQSRHEQVVSNKQVKEKVQIETESVDPQDQKLSVDSEKVLPEDQGIKEVVEEKETQKPPPPKPKPKGNPKPPVFTEAPFSLGKNPKNWDQQRRGWLEKYPWMKTTPNGKPRVLLVTGSSPWACANPVGDNFHLKSLKNKIDYTRQHNIELFYNIAHLERNLTSFWAKLPVIRKLMLTHPEIEWIFWMDADALFTDMLFEFPLEKYDDYNIVMWGWEDNVYKTRNWVAVNDGAFLFRNCQWSLDLLEQWAPMGPEGDIRNKWGEFFSEYMSERGPNFPADDQSALVYLMLTQTEIRSKIRLEWEYQLSGYWKDFVEKFEEFMTTPGNHPGLGGNTWPFITHFTGCQPCSGHHNPIYSGEECARQMERAYNFADNQILQTMGFMHEDLSSAGVKKIEERDEFSIVETLGPNTWASASKTYGL